MERSSSDYEGVYTSPSTKVLNVVLVGRTGNGKSSTGNSIIGPSMFLSKRSSGSVTKTCELMTNVFSDGRTLNVIDTPGLFDFSPDAESIGQEIIKCIKMAEEGIHAVLLVYSVKTRFSKEEEAVFHSLRFLFGEKVIDYMIVVFTGADDFEEGETIHTYLDCAPETLLEILRKCGNRKVIFDNKTNDGGKRAEQLKELLSLIDLVLQQNGGQPFTDEIHKALKGANKLYIQDGKSSSEGQMLKLYEEQLERITLMIELKTKEAILGLQKQLEEELAARSKLVEMSRIEQEKSNMELHKLREDLDAARCEAEEIRRQAEKKCTIL